MIKKIIFIDYFESIIRYVASRKINNMRWFKLKKKNKITTFKKFSAWWFFFRCKMHAFLLLNNHNANLVQFQLPYDIFNLMDTCIID